MARNSEYGLGRDGGGPIVGGGGGSKGERFIDRSKVRILLCDNDQRSSEEVFKLLCKCSYQVTSVKSARQVIDALNAEGPDIDIILTKVDLPMAKGMKLLKYITRDNDLRRIPVIMMSAQDEVSVVVKCLRFGAADYLVKPLCSNELLNVWTHMWRRRRMLGLTEKNILNFEVDVVASDPSDANTNSTTMFSDDTDERSRKSVNPDICMSVHLEDVTGAVSRTVVNAASSRATGGQPQQTMGYWPIVPIISDHQTEMSVLSWSCPSVPKKSQLKLGESSAFFTYVKSTVSTNVSQDSASFIENVARSSTKEARTHITSELQNNCETHDNGAGNHVAQSSTKEARTHITSELQNNCETHDNGAGNQVDEIPTCNGIRETISVERSYTPPATKEYEQPRKNKESEYSQVHSHKRNEFEITGFQTQSSFPYYMSGIMNQVIIPSSAAQHYQKSMHDLQNHSTPMPPQFAHHMPQCPPNVPGMPSFPYYPVNICLQPGQMPPTTHHWAPTTHRGSVSPDIKLGKIDRREAALIKFRQKRKERCFDKKIRYVNRKKLAERRPRVRGQFVRKMNGVNVDLNGLPSAEFDAEAEEYDDDQGSGSRDSSNEHDA